MDGTLWSIVITFIIDGVIFTILLILFLCFRKLRSKQFEGAGSDPFPALIKEGQLTLFQSIKKVWSTSEEEMLKHCHVEGVMYFKMHRNLALIFSLISVIGMAVLVSVYTQGSSATKEEIELAGIAHVVEEEDMLIASFLCMVLFTVLCSVILYQFFAINRRYIAAENLPETVLTVDNIPGTMEPSLCEQSLRKAIQPLFEHKFEVIVAPNWAAAYGKFKDVKPIRDRRLELEEYYQHNPEAPKKTTGCCKKTDELETLKKKEGILVEKVKAAMKINPKAVNSGTAFVITESKSAALELMKIMKTQILEDTSLMQKKWQVNLSKGPSNVLWECYFPSSSALVVKRILFNVIFFLVAFIFLSPTGFCQYIVLIFGSFGDSGSTGFIEMFLPTILLFIYMEILLPFFIELLVKKEQHRTNAASRISAMRKYVLFFTIYLYLVPLIGFQIVELINTVVSGDIGTLLNSMESRFTKTGLFFFIYMIHATFIKNGTLLLQPGVLVSRKLKERKAVLPATKEQAYWTVELNIPRDTAMTLVSIMMALTFAVIMPIIIPMVSMFLILKAAFQKYNLLCVNYVNPNTGGELVFSALINYLIAIVFFQWLTCFVLMITHFASWLALGAIVAASTLLQIGAFVWVGYRERKRKLMQLPPPGSPDHESETLMATLVKDYKHPLTDEFGVPSTQA